MSDQLLERVRAFLAGRGLLRPDALLLVAVSGGPDSLCLLYLLHRLREAGSPTLHVAHLDHGARGAQSAAEAAAVAALATAWGLPATVERRDVPALARASGEGLQAAARRARYAFLAETAVAAGAHAVVVAHQAGDQAETVLLHLLRGAGPQGLRGMREEVPWDEWAAGGAGDAAASRRDVATPPPPLLRPLLTTTRAEVEAYCTAHGLAPVDDPSNRDDRFARVRARHTLRALADENPRVVEAIGRAARILADDYDFIQAQLGAAWPTLAEETAAGVTLRRGPWEALHPALRRHALRRAAARLGQPELSLEQTEAALVVAARPGRRMRLGPQLWLMADQQALTLTWREAGPPQRLRLARPGTAPGARAWGGAEPPPQLPADEQPLPVPGSIALGAGWSIMAGAEPPPTAATPDQGAPVWVGLDPAALDGPLVLRRRRPGDRFRPAGGRGSRKLQDYFVDTRVPHGLRAAWPILATPAAIVWVVGLRADARFVAPEQSQGTIWVALTRDQDG